MSDVEPSDSEVLALADDGRLVDPDLAVELLESLFAASWVVPAIPWAVEGAWVVLELVEG